jgi:GxxExxY protein
MARAARHWEGFLSDTPDNLDVRVEPSREHDRIAKEIVDSAYAVHVALGPGLLESLYEECLAVELEARSFKVRRQVAIPVVYRTVRVDAGYRMDMLVNDLVVVEVKAVEKLIPLHEAQLLTYLKLSRYQLGLLVNFNVPRVRDGIRRVVLSP